jgi:hypothetical protein
MIVISVRLESAIHASRSKELARMQISNISGAGSKRSYLVEVFRGRSKELLDRRAVQRTAQVRDYPALALHIWHLVAEALAECGYGRKRVQDKLEQLKAR